MNSPKKVVTLIVLVALLSAFLVAVSVFISYQMFGKKTVQYNSIPEQISVEENVEIQTSVIEPESLPPVDEDMLENEIDTAEIIDAPDEATPIDSAE